MLLVSAQLVMGGYYAKKLALGLVGITWALHFYQHYSVLGKNMRVMPLRVLGVGYWPVRNLCSSASWSTLPGVNCHPVLQAKGYVACVSTVFVSKGSHLLLIWLTPVSLCFDDRANP
jgi:hypothetical protein